MRSRLLGSLMALAAGGGLLFAQAAPVTEAAPGNAEPPAAQAPALPDLLLTPPTPGCYACEGECGPRGELWGSAEFLIWAIENGKAPPLVSAGPPGSLGIIGRPGTTILLNNLDNGEPFPGGRFVMGMWLDDFHTFGWETGYLFTGTRSRSFAVRGPGTAPAIDLGVPFFNLTTGLEDAAPAAVAGVANGNVQVGSATRIQSFELTAISNLACTPRSRLDAILGLRWLQFNEGVGIAENTTVLSTVPFVGGTSIVVNDQFSTTNSFYGGQVGLRGEYRWRSMYFNARGQLGLGCVHQVVNIQGGTIIQPPAPAAAVGLVGGIFAQPSNIGRYSRNEFGALPELGLTVGLQVTERARAFLGYTVMWWTNAARPGDQIDRVVNVTQSPFNRLAGGALVGPARPAFTFNDSDFWVQGLNVGVEFRY